MILRLFGRGLATLFVFVLTFILSLVVGFYILAYILGTLGYGIFPNESSPQAPPWFIIGSRVLLLSASLALASFKGWKTWKWSR